MKVYSIFSNYFRNTRLTNKLLVEIELKGHKRANISCESYFSSRLSMKKEAFEDFKSVLPHFILLLKGSGGTYARAEQGSECFDLVLSQLE